MTNSQTKTQTKKSEKSGELDIMTMTKNELKNVLDVNTWDDLDEVLGELGLTTDPNNGFSDDEAALVADYVDVVVKNSLHERYQALKTEDRTYSEVLALIKEELKEENQPQESNTSESKTTITLFELIEESRKRTEQPLSLARTLEFLKLSRLVEKENYTSEEVETFLKTCTLIIQEGKSYAEVAELNGITETENPFLKLVTKHSTTRGEELSGFLEETGAQLDKNIATQYSKTYLQSLSRHLNSPQSQQKIQESRQKILKELNDEQWREFDQWEARKRQELHIEQADTINVLPSGENT